MLESRRHWTGGSARSSTLKILFSFFRMRWSDAVPKIKNGLEFAEMEQAHHVIDVGGGQEHAADRRVGSVLIAGTELRRRDDLGAEIGGGADQEPDFAVVRERDLSLGTGLSAEFALASAAAVVAGAVPLWEAASGCRTQNFDAHGETCREARDTRKRDYGVYGRRTQKRPLPGSGR